MSEAPDFSLGATTVVQVCAGVQPGDAVVIVTDDATEAIARAVGKAATEAGAEVTFCLMPKRMQDSGEPPAPISAAMKAADVIFTPVSVSITHTDAIREACAAGARAVAMTGFTPRMMQGGGIEADFVGLEPICQHVASLLHAGSHLHLTTPGGTDLTASIQGRQGIAKTCIVRPGDFSPVPDIEATVSPVEGSASGVIVADASIPYLGIGVLAEPVFFSVQDGYIVEVNGGPAKMLRDSWEATNDPHVFNVAEVGIGLNPACRLTGEMLEDEGCWGTVHIGTGTSTTLGGLIKAACHYDLLMHKATLRIDNTLVLADGELVGMPEHIEAAIASQLSR
jgi:2,5-dihydroxypyridine 5,6-dioxygenase